MNPVTPWTATVKADIVNSTLIYETQMSQYKLQIFNAGDSIWLTVDWPNAGSIAFRVAFGMNSDFEEVSVSEKQGSIFLTAPTRLGYYTITLSFPDSKYTLLRYTTTFKGAFPILNTFLAS
jgi:hypothetical protein